MSTSKPFVGVNISPEVLQRIDDYRYNNRIPSRAKAIEKILRAGMDAMANDFPELDLAQDRNEE